MRRDSAYNKAMHKFRVILGIAVWIGIGGALWWSLDTLVARRGSVGSDALPQLFSYAVGHRTDVDLEFTGVGPFEIDERMPIYIVRSQDDFEQIGHVTIVQRRHELAIYAEDAEAILYPDIPPIPQGSSLILYQTPESVGWIIKSMTTGEKWQQVLNRISDTIAEHQDEIVAALRPIVEESLVESFEVVKADLPAALAKHKDALQALGEKYEREIIKKKIVPLVKTEIWPDARERAIPLAKQIGEEMWARVSVWKFGFKAFVDKLPFTKGDSVQLEFDRFLKQDAIPILNRHSDDMMKLVGEVIANASKNEEVRKVLRESMSQITKDPELHRIVFELSKELVVENPKLKKVMEKHWTSDRAKAAFRLAGERLEPLAMYISDTLFGTREHGISPQLARVLRFRLLKKDKRWLELHIPDGVSPDAPAIDTSGTITLQVRRGYNPPFHPFVPEIGGYVDVTER